VSFNILKGEGGIPLILLHSDPLWKKHCMSNKKIISCFQYPVKTTVFTVSRKSFHTGCSNLTSMFLYVVIFQQMTCFFAVQTSPNMIGLTVKNIIIKIQLNFFLKFLVFYFVLLPQCGLAALLIYMTLDKFLILILWNSNIFIELYSNWL
jgi:hypothetical protein